MRTDLNMRKGKMVAQGAHASSNIIINAIRDNIIRSEDGVITGDDSIVEWVSTDYRKITLGVNSLKLLEELVQKAKNANLLTTIVIDNGKTEFDGVKTCTCAAIGPGPAEIIDSITGQLKLI